MFDNYLLQFAKRVDFSKISALASAASCFVVAFSTSNIRPKTSFIPLCYIGQSLIFSLMSLSTFMSFNVTDFHVLQLLVYTTVVLCLVSFCL